MELSVLNYTDYRTFLADYCHQKRRIQQGWSLRNWTRQLGLKSPAALAMIVRGMRSPRLELARKITKSIELNLREESYFLDLVRLEKIKNDPDASLALQERLAKVQPSGTYKHLNHRIFSVISQWYCYAIRDMVHLADFRENPDWISKHLSFPVTSAQVSEALGNLLKVGLIRHTRGRLRVTHQHIDTTSDVADEAIKRCHEQILDNAKVAIRKFPPEKREIIGTTFAFSSRDIRKAKESIRQFQLDFCKTFERQRTDAVYHLEISFHPVAEGETQ